MKRIYDTRRWKDKSFSRSHYTAGRSVWFGRFDETRNQRRTGWRTNDASLSRSRADTNREFTGNVQVSRQASNDTAVPSLRKK